MKKKNIKKQNGISLIALTTTILVLAVITSILTYNAKNSVEIRKYKNLENDINLLQSKVEMYYLKNNELPIFKVNNVAVKYTSNPSFRTPKQSNDNDNYYVIDLSNITGITLNYGMDFYNKTSNGSNINTLRDLYVINEQSHRIYYVAGVTANNKTYYTIGTDVQVTMH